MASEKPTVGQIMLTTHNGGDIETGNLIIEDGWRHAEINVKASGNLTVNGDVKVGSESAILNAPPQASAEAMIYLSAGDDVTLNGEVYANAHGIEESVDTTKAYIEILAGENANINGDLFAEAKSSNNGTADAVIKVEAAGEVVFDEGVEVHAVANDATADSTGPDHQDDEETISNGHAQIIINDNAIVLEDDNFSTPKSVAIEIDVLDNDILEEGNTIDSYTDPTDGTLTPTMDGGEIVGFTYNPPEDLSTLTFDENGEAAVTFTYTVDDYTATVTITLVNELPSAVNDVATTPKADPIDIASVVVNDADLDTTDSLTVVPDSFSTTTKNGGTVTPIYDGEDIIGFNYDPPDDLSGLIFDENGEATDSFTYTVTDGFNTSVNTGEVKITLINGLPNAVDDLATTFKNQLININVLTNDTDPDLGDVLTVVEGAITTKNGTLVLNEDGTFTYTPDEGFVGTDSFTYSATDSFNTISEVEVKITVNEKPSLIPALLHIPSAPLPEILEFDISGNPALAKWVALELGVEERMIDIWVVNTLASTKNIQPYDTYTSFKAAATILQDADGFHIAALAQVINEFASSDSPPTEEQMASIADAIARNTDDDNNYAEAGEYLDALATYTGILSDDMGFSTVESVQFVTDKYVGRLAQGDNVGVATFIAANLAALGG